MIVGNKKSREARELYNARSNKAIQFALAEIKKSDIGPFVQHIYLYGSCARNEQSYGSDVDLLIELDESFRTSKGKLTLISELRSRLSSHDEDLPDIEIKFVIGEQWKTDNTIFFSNVRRDGKKLW